MADLAYAEKSPSQPTIPAALEEAHAALGELDDVISKLESQLHPVLEPRDPEPALGNAMTEIRQQSEVRDQISIVIARIRDQRARVVHLLTRLEL